MPKAEVNLGGLSSLVVNTPITSVSLSHLSSESSKMSESKDQENNCERPKESTILHPNVGCPVKSEPTEPGDEDEEDAYSNELDDEEVLGELTDSIGNKDFPLLNQSISPLSSSVLKFIEKGTSSSSGTIAEDTEKKKQAAAAGRSNGNVTNSYSIGGKDFADGSISRDGTTAAPSETTHGH